MVSLMECAIGLNQPVVLEGVGIECRVMIAEID